MVNKSLRLWVDIFFGLLSSLARPFLDTHICQNLFYSCNWTQNHNTMSDAAAKEEARLLRTISGSKMPKFGAAAAAKDSSHAPVVTQADKEKTAEEEKRRQSAWFKQQQELEIERKKKHEEEKLKKQHKIEETTRQLQEKSVEKESEHLQVGIIFLLIIQFRFENSWNNRLTGSTEKKKATNKYNINFILFLGSRCCYWWGTCCKRRAAVNAPFVLQEPGCSRSSTYKATLY